MQRIAIVDPNDATREPLRSLLLGVDFVWLEAECARYDFFYDVIVTSTPDSVIVAMDADRTKALQLITQLSAEFPKLPILAISSDHQSLLQSLQRGARYFLTHPIVLEDLLGALRRLGARGTSTGESTGRPDSMHSAPRSQVYAVLGSRGGVGATTLAVNLGCSLAHAVGPAGSVALVDLDLLSGDADLCLDLNPDRSIADVALNIERLDMNFLRQTVIKHQSTGLSLLTRPLQTPDAYILHEEHLQRIVNLLKISHSHLVLDLTKGLLPTDRTALQIADVILLVCTPELSSLRNAVRLLMGLSSEEGIGEKIRVVLNRVGNPELGENEIARDKVQENLGKEVAEQIPNDPKSVTASRARGVPLIQSAPSSKAHQAIYGLALKLLGRTPAPAAGGSSILGRLFGGRKKA